MEPDQPISRRRTLFRMLASGAAISSPMLSGCDRIPDVVKIGIAQPLSGPLASLGQDMLNGATMAVDKLNAGRFKVKGKAVKLNLIAADDRADVEAGKQAAATLVAQGVCAVVGHLNSGVSIAAAPIYAAAKIPQLAISTNPRFTQMGLATTFRLVANDDLQARALASFATQGGVLKRAVVDDGTTYGKGLADAVSKWLEQSGQPPAFRRSFDDKTTSFDPLARDLKAAGIQQIISALNDFQVAPLVEALDRVGHDYISVIGGDTLKTPTGLKVARLVRGGLFASSPVIEAREFPAGPSFLEAYRRAFKVDPAYGGHYSFDAIHVLAEAVQRANSAEPEAIVHALRSFGAYAPVTGSMKFDAQGEQVYGAIAIYVARAGVWDSQMRSDKW